MTEISPLYSVTDLGIMPGFESSRATSLNDRGQVIGSLSREDWDFSPNGFLWAEGKMRDLGNVSLKSINNKGQIVGIKFTKDWQFSAAIYMAGRFQELLKNTSAVSTAGCINDCGQVVGFIQSTNWKIPAKIKRGCFVWENGKRRYLDAPEGYQASNAVSVNNQGQIVGELWESGPHEDHAVLNKRHAVLWEGVSITLLNESSGFNESKAVAINNQGQVLVKAFQSMFSELFDPLLLSEKEKEGADTMDNQKIFSSVQQKLAALPKDVLIFRQQSFLWHNGEMQVIDGLASALNDQGQVVGWSGCDLSAKALAGAIEAPSAFLWQKGELIDLNDLLPPESGWRLTRANDINNNGQIVGHGKFNDNTRAFLLTPITK